jgi:sporulation integral membrane protein YlbJ
MATIRIKKEYLSLVIILWCIFLIFRFPEAVKEGVNEGINICFYTIIPSLFPFMTISTYIVRSDILSPFYNFLSLPVRVLFKQPASAVSVIILSMVGGFPVGIKMANDLYTKGRITKEQAQRLCLFCMNAGPAFVITAVGANILGNTKAGIIIYSSLCISAFISGVISSFVADKNNDMINQKNEKPLQLSSLSSFVTDSLQCIFNICAWIILFSSITQCIEAFSFPEQAYIYITSFLEVTKGCSTLAGNTILPIFTGIIGFGGICVHCQVLEYLKNMQIKYRHFFISRILSGISASVISYILFLLFPVEADVFSNSDQISSYSFSFSYSAFFIFILMCVIMILDIDRNKKYDKIS